MLRKAFANTLDALFHGFISAIYDDVSFRIDGVTDPNQTGHDVFRAALSQKWSAPSAMHAPQKDVDWRSQPDRNGMLPHKLARLRVHPCTAACCQDAGWSLDEALDDPAFTCSEIGFSVTGEDFGNRATGGAFYLCIGINERQAINLCQAAADSGFSGSHHADENNCACRGGVSDRPIGGK
ncbi:hypothetical protein GCM10010937_03970 [Gluconobacter japonicus]|uniref:Uncharacterized protein n=1 Tax=Gluconobacter japonicus TaxID=376620 RepID=A0ABQ5WEQ2_GLUJA|nr:hypothetical protein AA3271_0192 [Gluconobacter japonicus NBRC 3271]GLQ58595.1 hypothetical protein GCM10010937_03970 [Gluconobacter japonicus]